MSSRRTRSVAARSSPRVSPESTSQTTRSPAADFGKASRTVQFDSSQGPGTCANVAVNAGQSVVGDVLVATPSSAFPAGMVHSTVKAPLANSFFIRACNVTGELIKPDPTSFSWVVLDA
ncbi:MAG TPA: hypothetical protein VNA28_10195 [Solirubrobacteraceae bacterium]|nr:hypothetical protein [Solirubrobacteraceae bacterium]